MVSRLKKAIGAVKDRTSISLAKVTSNNKTNLEVAVLKATTHDHVPIDERRVDEILNIVSSDKANAASCARAIGKRIGRTRNWIVALKSLMLVLRIFQDGDPYFPREVLHAMKRGAKILNLSNFRDESASNPWDYTAFIRTVAMYLDERLECFLTGKLQRRYTQSERWKGNELVRDMKPAMLLDKISFWLRLLERAVATRPTGSARSNRLVQISLYTIVQETFSLYRDISDGLGLLLDRFFHLQYNSCVNAFQACLKATKQFEELSGFYDLCKSIGVGRTSEYPSVQLISEELIGTLQEFLKDQSSFPGRPTTRGPLLLPARSSVEEGSDSDKRQESSKNPGIQTRTTSLEDLISATELTEPRPPISIDLEAYSINDQSRLNFSTKGSPNDDDDDMGSTRSLPVSSSIADLVTFEAWPQIDQQVMLNAQKLKTEQSAKDGETALSEAISPSSSQLVLHNFDPFLNQGMEVTTSSSRQVSEGFDPFRNHEPEATASSSQQFWVGSDPFSNKNHDPTGSGKGWEIILSQSSENLNSQNLVNSSPTEQAYNPFLQDLGNTVPSLALPEAASTATLVEFPISNDSFAAAPTFQATPTFLVQDQSSTSSFAGEIDPFVTTPTRDESLSLTVSQPNLLQEQELWIQQQNKIISRHIA